jgi:hypothetical protein
MLPAKDPPIPRAMLCGRLCAFLIASARGVGETPCESGPNAPTYRTAAMRARRAWIWPEVCRAHASWYRIVKGIPGVLIPAS